MKIGNTPGAAGVGALNGATAGTRDTPAKGSTGTAAAGDSSTVTLSSAANALFDGSVEGSFDQEKVDRIRQSIADGTYTVNHGAIADKLIANAQELLGKVSNR
jgi:negative regulator of flagellin synthesis FlgM